MSDDILGGGVEGGILNVLFQRDQCSLPFDPSPNNFSKLLIEPTLD